VHVVAVVGREPHEVRSRPGIEIIDERTVSDRTTAARISKHDIVTASRIVCDILEGNETVVTVFIGLLVARVAAHANILVFHVGFPRDARGLEAID
jgi:hypothetical protein